MNHLTTYEQLVAEKLQQLPVPDMADAIWARIEQQLDVEMPVDKPGDATDGYHSLPGFKFPGNGILYIFLAAIVVTLFLVNKSTGRNDIPATPATKKIITPVLNNTDQKKSIVTDPSIVVNTTDTTTTSAADLGEYAEKETPVMPVINNASAISVNEPVIKQEQAPFIEPVQKKISLPLMQDSAIKKRRGVLGLTSNDYRIAPVRKDSL